MAKKSVMLIEDERVFRYRKEEFLSSSVDLPVTGAVVEASPAKPYLCLALGIEPTLFCELASVAEGSASTDPAGQRAIFVGKRDEAMTNAFARLVDCLDRIFKDAVP